MDKKLNIFFSNSISAHKWGGGEKWMITAACGLQERGHRVTLSGKANSNSNSGKRPESDFEFASCSTNWRRHSIWIPDGDSFISVPFLTTPDRRILACPTTVTLEYLRRSLFIDLIHYINRICPKSWIHYCNCRLIPVNIARMLTCYTLFGVFLSSPCDAVLIDVE